MMRSLIFGACLFLIATTGCHHDAAAPKPIDFHAELPNGMVALRQIEPADYPSFAISAADAARIVPAIDNSLAYLAAPSSRAFYPYLDITHDRAVATLKRLRELCTAGANSAWDPAQFDQEIRREFNVYKSYGAPDPNSGGFTDRVLFTGYFTPIYDGSLQRTNEYCWPLYRLPKDLQRDPNTGETLGRKNPDGILSPYYTRAQIDQGAIAPGQEIVWLKSRWEAYVVTIQGSAQIRLIDSGRRLEIGYAGNNGYPYTSPGAQMLADGVITRDQLSLKGLTEYFDAHPQAMDKYLAINQRDVFFTERPGGPFGSLNQPVTAMATIATDKAAHDIYPRALAAFLVVPIPVADTGGFQPFRGFMLDQDTGGGIRASGRCDIYMGTGPAAQAVAGHELQEGSLYYLALRMDALPASESAH